MKNQIPHCPSNSSPSPLLLRLRKNFLISSWIFHRHRHKSGKSSTGSSPAPSHRSPPDNPIHTSLDGQSTRPFAIQLIPAFSTRPCAFNSCAMLRSPRYELRQPPSPLPPPPAFDDGGYEPVGEPGVSSPQCDRPETR